MKKDPAALLKYLQNFTPTTIESYFKKSEVPVEVLQGVLSAMASVDGAEWMGNLLVSLSKAENFDMTLMFCEDSDKANVRKIVDSLQGTNAKLSAEVKTKLTAE